jgi:hypothetical protein
MNGQRFVPQRRLDTRRGMLSLLDSFVRRYASDESVGVCSITMASAGPARRTVAAAPGRAYGAAPCSAHYAAHEHAQPEDEEAAHLQHGVNPQQPALPSSWVTIEDDASCFDRPFDDLEPELRRWMSEGRLLRLAHDLRYSERDSRRSHGLSDSSIRSRSTESLLSRASTSSSAPKEFGGDENSFYRMLDVGVFA